MKLRRVAAVLCSLMMVTSLVGCSVETVKQKDSQKDTSKDQSSGSSSQSDSSDSEYAYVIGHYGGITGQVATTGAAGLNAIKLAIKQWNDNGGVLGGKIGFEFYDDGATPEGATKGASYLIDERHVDGIIASQLSGNIQATGDIVNAAQIPEIGTGTNPAWTNKGWNYLFRAMANVDGGTAPLVTAMEETNIKTLATLIYQDDGNIAGNTSVMEVIKERGTIDVIAEEKAMIGETDWTGALSSIISKNPDGVMILSQGEQGTLMLKQIRSLGYTGYVFGCETMAMPDVRAVAGDGANGTIFFSAHVIPDTVEEAKTEEEKAFLTAYVEEYGEMPAHDVAYRAYDAVNILLTGVETAGTKDGPTVRDTIANMKIDLLAGAADFGQFDNGECLSEQKIFIIHDGKNMLLSDYLAENPVDTYK